MTVVTGNHGLLVSGPSQDDEGIIRISLLGSPDIVNYYSFTRGVGVDFRGGQIPEVRRSNDWTKSGIYHFQSCHGTLNCRFIDPA